MVVTWVDKPGDGRLSIAYFHCKICGRAYGMTVEKSPIPEDGEWFKQSLVEIGIVRFRAETGCTHELQDGMLT